MNHHINKSDIVERLSTKLGSIAINEINSAVNYILKHMREAISEERNIAIRGFGTFQSKQHLERNIYNPITKQLEKTPARIASHFKAGKILQDKLNKS